MHQYSTIMNFHAIFYIIPSISHHCEPSSSLVQNERFPVFLMRYVFFLIYILFFIFYITTKPTKAHSSQRRPTQVNAPNLDLHLPSTTTNESLRLVGGLLGLHLPSTATNES